VTDRDNYVNDPTGGHLWGYDIENPSVNWGATAEAAWSPIAQRSFVEGGFVWTAFDYKGEPTPYAWPDINSHFGVIDIAGFPKDLFHWYQVWWTNDNTTRCYLFPHWNWQTGDTVDVWVFSNADSVELFLNGVSQGKQTMPVYGHVEWQVKWVTGTISATAYKNNVAVATDQRTTTGTPYAIVLTERVVGGQPGIYADGQDVGMIEVSVVDNQGQVVPGATNNITFSISGPGTIFGVGNGDPADLEPDKANYRSVWHGLALVEVQATTTTGSITVTATSSGLKSASVAIQSTTPPPSMMKKSLVTF